MSAAFTAEEILYATSGYLKSGHIDESKGSIIWEIDDVKPGDWFIAIPSELEDPHDNLNLALEKGARGAVVNRRSRYASASKGATIISVSDTRTALLDLTRYWRYCVRPRVVGVSGSRGRRVTMALLSELLQDNYRTHVAFLGNLGWFGCIKEVLSMPSDTQLLIFEAGAVERGDIARIGGALDPDLAVITQTRHPLSPERDAVTAGLYCELLETLAEFPKERVAAVIYDDNPALQQRANYIFTGLSARKHSFSDSGIAYKMPERCLQELSEALESSIGQPITCAELWCAVEAARVLGVSSKAIEEIFEITGESAGDNLHTGSIKQIAQL